MVITKPAAKWFYEENIHLIIVKHKDARAQIIAEDVVIVYYFWLCVRYAIISIKVQ